MFVMKKEAVGNPTSTIVQDHCPAFLRYELRFEIGTRRGEKKPHGLFMR
jgi:hypothetical protein